MFDNNFIQPQFTLEMTVVSAQGLKSSSSSIFSRRLRPFITLTTFPPTSCGGDKGRSHVHQTRVDDHGGINPTWGDKFHVPIDNTFFANRYSCIYLQLFTKRLITGQAQLGWCQIPAADIGLPPVGSVRQLSYRLRGGDGARTYGIVNVAIRLKGQEPAPAVPIQSTGTPVQLSNETCRTVIGIPVGTMTRGRDMGSSWKSPESLTIGRNVLGPYGV